jgi:hypothetical protein
VKIAFSVHSDSADVPAAKGAGVDEVGRFEARCTSTRAAAQALLNTCHITNPGDFPAGVLALLTGQGIQNP